MITDTSIQDVDLYPGMMISKGGDKPWTLVKLATREDAEALRGEASILPKGAWDRLSLKWIGVDADGKQELLCFDPKMTKAAYNWTEPNRSPREWADEIRRLEFERYGERKQSAVNYDYAQAYENALKEIATLLGWKASQGSPTGCPPEDINQTALRLVKERLK